MKHCANCGAELNDNAAFCTQCGSAASQQEPSASTASQQQTPEQQPNELSESQERATSEQESEATETSTHTDGEEESAGLADAAGEPVDSETSPAPTKKKKKPIIIAVIVLLALLIIGGGIAWYFSNQAQLAVEKRTQAYEALNEEQISEVLSGQEELMKGIASNDYVTESPYKVQGFEIADKTRSEDEEQAQVKGTATIQNEFFKESAEISASFTYDADAGLYQMESMTIDSTSVTPIRGIAEDKEHGLENLTSDDTDFSMRTGCQAKKISDEKSYWFGKTGTATVYTYQFKDNKWSYASEANATGLLDISGVFGNYEDRRSGTTYEHGFFKSFEVKAVEEGVFNRVYVNFVWEPAGKISGSFDGDIKGSMNLVLELDGDKLKFSGENGSAGLNANNIVGEFVEDGIQFTGGYWTNEKDPSAGAGKATINMNDLKLYRTK